MRMTLLRALERKLEPYTIPHLTMFLVAGQTFVYLTSMLGLIDERKLLLLPALVLQGELWRVLSFVFVPPDVSWLFIAFALYLFYLFGSTLEQQWGAVRYHLFLLTGYVLTVGLSFLTPLTLATNVFIGGAVFLAFAYLNPTFIMYVLFVIPVQIRWLALLTWIGYVWSFFQGGWGEKFAVLAATGNFLLFFTGDIVRSLGGKKRHMSWQAKAATARRVEKSQARHQCCLCEKNSNTHPQLDFRYCSKCAGDRCYCPDHLHNHEHVTE